MKIAVVGTGYVGLVTGACFADFGHKVTCLDRDVEKVTALAGGKLPIYEPGLEALVARTAKDGRLKLGVIDGGESTTIDDAHVALANADVIVIAVGTPQEKGTNAPSMAAVHAVARLIGRVLRTAPPGHTVVMTKSTVPVGTADAIRAIVCEYATREVKEGGLLDARTSSIVSCPEFLKEGSAVEDFMRPARVVVGVEPDDERAKEILTRLFAPLVRTTGQILFMGTRSAELTKYAANGILATRISFMNEVANLAERTGASVDDVRLGIGSDPRIGSAFLYAGAGYGGSCFPKDLRALLYSAEEAGCLFSVVAAADKANERQKRVLGDKILALVPPRGKICVWGLAFKPGTDDVREAPALVLIEQLLRAGYDVTAYDPVAMDRVRETHTGFGVSFAPDMYAAAEGADAIALVTEWHEFRRPDFERLRAVMGTPAIFDGRNVIDAAEARAAGFDYYGIGR